MDISLNTPMDEPWPFVCAMCAVEGEAQISVFQEAETTFMVERKFEFAFKCDHCAAKVSFRFSDMESLRTRLEDYRKGSRVFLSSTLRHSMGDDVGVPVYEKGGEKTKRDPVMIVTASGYTRRGYLHTRCIKSGKKALISSVVEYDDGPAPEWWQHEWANVAAKEIEED